MKELFDMMRSHMKRLTRGERVAYLAQLLWHSPYLWGSEHIGGTDCSGTVCFALWLMGYNIRVTADVLWKKFCERVEKPAFGDLVFWLNPDGKARHVAIYIDPPITLNASPDHIEFVSVSNWQKYVGRLDFDLLAQASVLGENAWGVDSELPALSGIFSEENL